MTLSIPDDLREQMASFDEETNWSAVAARAFRREVARLQQLAAIDDKVKRRLLRTEIEDGEDFRAEGGRGGA